MLIITFQLLQVTQLCKELTVAEWWTVSHTSGAEQAWSIPVVKDELVSNYYKIKFTLIIYTFILSSLTNFLCLFLQDRYTFLYQEKYRDDNVGEHPVVDKKL